MLEPTALDSLCVHVSQLATLCIMSHDISQRVWYKW